MFKVGKLNDVLNEEVVINYVTYTINDFKTRIVEELKTLSFCIKGRVEDEIFCFYFELNCNPKELLNFENSKIIDFNKYIFEGDKMFTLNGITDLDPETDIKILRSLENNFIIIIDFKAFSKTSYFGTLEIEFNLDDYL